MLKFEPEQRYVERAYLLAEIVSSTDYAKIPGGAEPWIEVKRRLYLAHEPCEAVLIIEQTRIEVRADIRSEAGWTTVNFSDRRDELFLPSFRLRCRVADLYEGTQLHPRTPSARI